MVPETLPESATKLPDGYPFHIGTRPVVHLDHAGNFVEVEYIPLSEDDYLHPQEEDRQMLVEAHIAATNYLRHALLIATRDRPAIKIFADHRIDWQIEGIKPHGPDLVVFDNFTKAWDTREGALPVRDFGAKVVAAFEVTSPSTRHIDFDEKFEEFADAGIPYYLIVDTAEPNGNSRILGYRLVAGEYRPMRRDPSLGFIIPPLKMYFRWENDRVIASDEDGNDIPDSPELATLYETATLRASVESDRADAEAERANAAASRSGIEVERANAESARADAEASRADALAAELAELKARLTEAK